jgi:hypothetical protein
VAGRSAVVVSSTVDSASGMSVSSLVVAQHISSRPPLLDIDGGTT